MLGMLEGWGYEKAGAGSAASIHYVAEVMRRFYADRSEYMGDPDFFKVPTAGLLDPVYIRKRRDSIDREHATPSDAIHPGHPAGRESGEATHYLGVVEQGKPGAVAYMLDGGGVV